MLDPEHAADVVSRLNTLYRTLIGPRPTAASLVTEAVELIENQARRITFERSLAAPPTDRQMEFPLQPAETAGAAS